jgi:hypothetical protein
MAHVDEELQLCRARLAMDAMEIGRALLEGDVEEARFRTHLVHGDASRHDLVEVTNMADRVMRLLIGADTAVVPGIGRALLALLGAIDRM